MTYPEKTMKAIESFIDAKIGFAKAHPVDRPQLIPILNAKRQVLHDVLAEAMGV